MNSFGRELRAEWFPTASVRAIAETGAPIWLVDIFERLVVANKDVQLARIAHRQAMAPHQTFPMSEADADQWREQFQIPDAAELGGGEIPGPPAGWPGWAEWAADHWPSCTDS